MNIIFSPTLTLEPLVPPVTNESLTFSIAFLSLMIIVIVGVSLSHLIFDVIVPAYKRNKMRRNDIAYKENRSLFFTELINHFEDNGHLEKSFIDKPNAEARKKFLVPHVAKYLQIEPMYSEQISDDFSKAFLFHRARLIVDMLMVRNLTQAFNDTAQKLPKTSLDACIKELHDAATREKLVEKAFKKYSPLVPEGKKKKAKANLNSEATQNALAKEIWEALTPSQKSKVRFSGSKQGKIQALNSFRDDIVSPYDPALVFPYLLLMFPDEVGNPVNNSDSSSSYDNGYQDYHSSSSYDSSGSSSYSDSAYSSGSYDGGGGDGGGGGGGD